MTIKEWVQRTLTRRGYVLTMTLKYLKRSRGIEIHKYAGDYIRSCSLELVAREIDARGIEGSVAELGVYRGDFARIINEAFPRRKLYLFDTFEGFDAKDAEADRRRGYSSGDQDFSATDVRQVLGKMTSPEQCIVKRGRFPDSAGDVGDRFVFVSIDVDLYRPTYDGLSFFVPRLVPGGHIFVHDYNNDEYKGVRAAVADYCVRHSIAYFPLADACGSVVISR